MKPKKYHVILADNHPIKWSNALYYNVFSSLGLPTAETGCGRALHYYLFVGQTKRIAVAFPQARSIGVKSILRYAVFVRLFNLFHTF